MKFLRTNGKIINPIDFQSIKLKAENYASFNAFRDDISWIVHNCYISPGSDKKIGPAAKRLEQFVDEEIECLLDCKQCYLASNEHGIDKAAIMVCDKRHTLIWALATGTSFWPAKLMRVIDDTVRVRYFGDNTCETILGTSCYHYSTEPPRKADTTDELYTIALTVIELILNL